MYRHILQYCIFLSLLCPIVLLADNYIIINQVMYDTSLSEETSSPPAYNGEFVELYNAGTEDVELQGWQLKGGSPTEIWTFTVTDNIPSGGYLLVACRRGTTNQFQLSDWYQGALNKPVVYQNKIMLSNSGETITLCNAQNDTIDQMYYDGTSHKTNPDRLHAENTDSLPGDSCVSLHRSWVEFNAAGIAVSGTSQWRTERVSFSTSMLPYPSYQENYLLGTQVLPAEKNYVMKITPLDYTARINIDDGRPSVSSNVRINADIQYLDGLGRQSEIITMGITPNHEDLVFLNEYFGQRHISRQWLPVAMSTEGQYIAVTDIQSQAQTDYSDSRPFTEKLYESSAFRRPTANIRPGSIYENHEASMAYKLNDANDHVRIYTVNYNGELHTNGACYETAMLYKSIIADEDKKSVITYTDKQGQKIMEERNGSRTYYVYDDLGRIRFVLPNLSSTKLCNGNYALSNVTLKAIAYCYNYDSVGNLVYKRLPGCEPQYMVYDQLGQLVLKQDSNQRVENKWTLCAYDSLGRNLYVAEIILTTEHSQLISQFANQWQVEHYGNGQTNALQNTGYASTILDADDARLLSVNYYDNYDFLNQLSNNVKSDLTFAQESGYGLPHNNAIGMQTGTRIYNLSEGGFTATAYYYDAMGRVVQSRSTCSDDSHQTITSADYLFCGAITQKLIIQSHGDRSFREQYRYTYDHAGRPLNTMYQLNNEEEIILSSFSYDSIGRLVQNLLYKNMDTIAYSYDMRNMLKEARNKYYSEGLYYADNLPTRVSACYNGNLAALRVSNKNTSYTYAYAYDQQNRLTVITMPSEYASLCSEHFTYDESGDITSLKRFIGTQRIDELVYHYGDDGGHQLLSVDDNGVDADNYQIIEYHNGEAQGDTTMRYDANGNLIFDADRGISVIKYNILNLPDTIQFVNGNQIVNLYDAVGRKYRSITYTVIPTVVSSHYEIEHYTFDTDTVEYIVTEYSGNSELIYNSTDTISQRIFNSIGYYADSTYFYYIKDHLGNVCVVVDAEADTLIQRTTYYASGVPKWQSFGREKQPYLYNGKEFVEAHGLNTYDYGFRGYYAPIGRFTSIDPLAESTPWQSPYAYANNNYVNYIDWMGLMSVYECVVTNINGDVINVVNDNDNNIYICLDDSWEVSDGKEGLIWAAEMEYSYMWYWSRYIASEFGGGGGGHFTVLSGGQIATAIGNSLMKDVSLGIADGFLRDEFGKKLGPIGNTTTKIVAYGRTIENLYHVYDYYMSQGMSPRVAYDAAKEFLTIGVAAILDGTVKKTINGAIAIAPEVASIAVTVAPYILATAGVVLTGWCYYKAGEYFINTVNSLNATFNSKGFWGNLYGYGDDGSNW